MRLPSGDAVRHYDRRVVVAQRTIRRVFARRIKTSQSNCSERRSSVGPLGSRVYGDASDTKQSQQRQYRAALFPCQNYRREAHRTPCKAQSVVQRRGSLLVPVLPDERAGGVRVISISLCKNTTTPSATPSPVVSWRNGDSDSGANSAFVLSGPSKRCVCLGQDGRVRVASNVTAVTCL